jgi:predicted class III extradiol MEMO1 family dioxygenase
MYETSHKVNTDRPERVRQNTICGRNPVLQLLSMLEHPSTTTQSSSSSDSGSSFEIKFVRYEQSSRCETLRDSSVSYVSGLVLERE